MQTFIEYMIKISASYAVIYLFYWLVLRPLTNYKSNRFYLIITALLAFVIPLLRLDLFISLQTISQSNLINYVPSLHINAASTYIPEAQSSNLPFILVTIFISGVIICLSHFIMQYISFKKITAHAGLISTIQNIQLYHLDMDIMPFSFGKSVYVNKYKHSPAELEDIIKHESAHADQHHTIDVLIAEFVCILNWYNPFVWLIKKAIKQNLEFLADDTVLNDGADRRSYQYLLLKVTGYSPLSIASSFKLLSLKQRIYMMNKTRSSQKHLLKFLFVLPLIVVLLLAFRNDDTHVNSTITNTHNRAFMLGELSYNIQDANVDKLIKDAANESLLTVGKEFDLTTIMNEKDRLKLLLEKNGYTNINSHAITFLIDSTFENNRCAIEINIDLNRKSLSINNTNKKGRSAVGDRSSQVQTKQNINGAVASTVTNKQDKI
jgi:beta-lactamase regulating signal transducer with metallopeptidase domain